MDFPTFAKNANKPVQEVTIAAPAYNPNDARDVQARLLDQQWRDANRLRLGKEHPLSLNRDHANIGNARDPYTP